MSTTAARPLSQAAGSEAGLSSALPWREWFALDHRSLALLRIGMALMLFLDWFDRWPDIRVLHSDAGMLPRDAITGLQPFSIFMFHGSVWFGAVLNGLGCLLAVLLLVGWRTNFVVLLNWLLFIGVHTRLPVVMQGGDHLLRMMLFWSIFLPLGACWSVDAALSEERPRERSVLSLASAAYILQICIMYWYAGAWKWAPEWRGEGTAISLAVQIDYFATRFTLWLRTLPPFVLRAMTHGTIILEVLGPAVLFLPFNVAWQRLLMIFLFIGFHIGLGITLELMTFPWVCVVAWLAFVPTAFWDKVQAAYTTEETRGLTLAYDPQRPRARRWLSLLRTFLILNGSRLVAAEGPDLAPRLAKQGGWGVIDRAGQGHHGLDAIRLLVSLSPVFYPFARLLGWGAGRWVGEMLANRIGGPTRPVPAQAEGLPRPRWAPPGGVFANAIVLFCFVYIVLWNVRTFDFDGNRAVLPEQAAQLGQVAALEQGWGLFAPMPGRFHGWEVVVGTRRDGTQIALDKVRPGEGGGSVVWEQPELLAGTYPNGRWRKLLQNLPAINAYPYLLPYYSRFLLQEWNRQHGPEDELVSVDVYWMRLITVPPGEPTLPAEKVLLGQYKVADTPTSPTWFVVAGKLPSGESVDLLRGGAVVDWRRPDQIGSLAAVSPWQSWLFSLSRAGSLSYFAPGFVRYHFDDHNRRYEKPEHKVSVVELYQVQEVPGRAEPKRELLSRYPEGP